MIFLFAELVIKLQHNYINIAGKVFKKVSFDTDLQNKSMKASDLETVRQHL